MAQLTEQLERLNRKLKSPVYGTLLGIAAMFPPKESFGEGRSEAVVLNEEPRTFGYREQPQIVQFPPEPKVPDTVFSNVYQSEVPRDLYEAGIECLDAETGQAVLSMRGIIGSAQSLRGEGYGCSLDLQDSVMRMYSGLGEHLKKVDETALVGRLGEDNPIVKLVQDAGRGYQATVGRKSNLDTLMEQHPNDMTAVFNRYHG
ncbi:hypothetical protein HY495_03260 [Candidatus Woesearchaeota archaeon]|nr:hypothetical protein [Candidatus Woesearchaeota archaeon]